MYRKIFQLTTLFLISLATTYAQSSRAMIPINLSLEGVHWQSAEIKIPIKKATPFIAFSMVWNGEKTTPEVRFSEDGYAWTNWEALPMELHAEQRPGHWVSQLYFADKASEFVQIRAAVDMGTVATHFYNPGKTKKNTQNTTIVERDPQYCPCPQPTYEGRLDWCPDGTCPEDATPQFTTATHLIVHHSAGTNSATDWAAIVRSIWDFHTGVNGWDDIGYNWLVDPNGVIYEGRGDGRLGAHFCGTNGATMGVCVLGDFTDIEPTDEAIDGLTDLLSWKACDIGADPLESSSHSSSGLVLNHISGHRDGCSTQCPGNSFYPLFSDLRQGVADHIANSCAAIGPPEDLTATTLTETSISLDWEDITDNETGFEIERSNSFNGDYELIATVGENIVTYEDTGLTPNTGYYYQVRAFNDQDTSIYSNRAFASTVIVNNTDLEQSHHIKLYPNPTDGKLWIDWQESIPGDIQYRLLDTKGRMIKQVFDKGEQQIAVDLDGLSSGIYWLQIYDSQRASYYKVSKQ